MNIKLSRNHVVGVFTLALLLFFMVYALKNTDSRQYRTCSSQSVVAQTGWLVEEKNASFLCDKKNHFVGLLLPVGAATVTLLRPPSKENTAYTLSLTFQTARSLFEIMADDKVLESGLRSPTGVSGLALASSTHTIPPQTKRLTFQKSFGDEVFISGMTLVPQTKPLASTKTTLLAQSSSYFLLTFFVILCGVSLLQLGRFRPQNTYTWLTLVSFLFFLGSLYYGLPFVPTSGSYDPFDDRSYLEWAQFLSSLHPNISTGTSAAASGNLHLWGTGLFLAPPLLLFKGLFFHHFAMQPLNGAAFILLSTYVTMLCLGAVLFYFLAFRHLMSYKAAVVTACAVVFATSLLKWTYQRIIFTHVPEMFVLALGSYCFIKAYFTTARHRLLYRLGMGLCLLVLIQVRREDLLFFIPVVWYELFIVKNPLRKKILYAFLPLAFAAAGIVLLQATNWLTHVQNFWTVPTGYLMQYKTQRLIENSSVVFQTIFPNAIFGGLSIWAAIKLRAYQKHGLPFLGLFFAFILMCLYHDYPTGFEWQNRFLLKMSPIWLCAIGLLFDSLKTRVARFLCATLFFAGCVWQGHDYLAQLDPTFATYRMLFADKVILYPDKLPIHPTYCLPLFCLLLVTVFFLIRVGLSAKNNTR